MDTIFCHLQNKVEALLMQSKGFNEEIKKVWEQVADRMFSLKPPQTQLGLGEQVCKRADLLCTVIKI